jgi:hypothetical protein
MPSVAVAGTGKTLERLWEECQTERMSAVASRHNLTTQQLVALLQQSGLIDGGSRDPSRSEIQRECQKFQREWTREQALQRWVGRRRISEIEE